MTIIVFLVPQQEKNKLQNVFTLKAHVMQNYPVVSFLPPPIHGHPVSLLLFLPFSILSIFFFLLFHQQSGDFLPQPDTSTGYYTQVHCSVNSLFPVGLWKRPLNKNVMSTNYFWAELYILGLCEYTCKAESVGCAQEVKGFKEGSQHKCPDLPTYLVLCHLGGADLSHLACLKPEDNQSHISHILPN